MAFQEPITNHVLQFAKQTYGTTEEYLWARLPDAAIMRRPDNRKWYIVFMTIDRRKVGLEGTGTIELIDLKADPLLVDALRARPGFLPAYHMNKLHWVTIMMDGTVPAEDICELVRHSYDCAGKK